MFFEFTDGSVLVAGPHLYDYAHSMSFFNGKVTIVDGAGQGTSTNITLPFSVIRLSHDLTQNEQGRGILVIGNTPNTRQEFEFVIETGLWVARNDIVWGVSDPMDIPFTITRRRIRFSKDPMVKFNSSRRGLKFMLERGFDDDTRHIY